MARNGLEYLPLMENGSVLETVKCTWCGIGLGPFSEICGVEGLHLKATELAGMACSFCR